MRKRKIERYPITRKIRQIHTIYAIRNIGKICLLIVSIHWDDINTDIGEQTIYSWHILAHEKDLLITLYVIICLVAL